MAFSDFKTVSEVQKEFRITYSEDDFVRGEPSTPSEHFLKEDDTSLKRCQFECRRGSANTRTLPTPKEDTMKDTTPIIAGLMIVMGNLLIVTALLLMLMMQGCSSDASRAFGLLGEEPTLDEKRKASETHVLERIDNNRWNVRIHTVECSRASLLVNHEWRDSIENLQYISIKDAKDMLNAQVYKPTVNPCPQCDHGLD